jgi:hypothetical protein
MVVLGICMVTLILRSQTLCLFHQISAFTMSGEKLPLEALYKVLIID